MDKNRYCRELDNIKASNRLKKRIIEEVEGQGLKDKSRDRCIKIISDCMAIAGIALIATVFITGNLKNNGEKDTQPGAAVETTEISENDRVEPTDLSNKVAAVVKEKYYNEVGEISLSIEITNNLAEDILISKDFYITALLDENNKNILMDNNNSSQTEEESGNNNYGELIELSVGESVVLDISECFEEKYHEYVSIGRDINVNFKVYSKLKSEIGVLYVPVKEEMPVVPYVKTPCVRVGDTELVVGLDINAEENFSGTIIYNAIKKVNINKNLLEKVESIAGAKEVDGTEENQKKDYYINNLPELDSGKYYLEMEILSNNTGRIYMAYVPFIVADVPRNVNLKTYMSSEFYNINSDEGIYAVVESTDSKYWKDMTCKLYYIESDGRYTYIPMEKEYHSSYKLESEIFYINTVQNRKSLNEGRYALVITVSDVEGKSNDENGENVAVLKAEFNLLR